MKKRAETEPAKGDAVFLDGGLDEHTVLDIYRNDQGQRVARVEDMNHKVRVVDLYRLVRAD